MIKTVVYNFVIPSFIFELSAILYDWLMMSFRLQNVKKVYETDHVSKRKSTQRTFFSLHVFLNIIPVHETTFIQLNLNVIMYTSLTFTN